MGARAKGVSGIKTLASIRGSGVHSNERHVHQFQIASLELERTRRIQERQSTLNRLKSLEERLAGIDEEIRKHQAVLGQEAPSPQERKPAAEPKAEDSERRRQLFRY
jgi:septal ring factor EnvC (AmiA/AmiB activator)